MPRPNRETKADRAIAMLEQGMKPPEIAAELGCSANYVRVCRMRAKLEKQGIRRSTLTKSGYAKVLTPETREKMYRRIAKKVSKSLRKHQGRARDPAQYKAQQERARQRARELHEKRILWLKEQDDMVISSITRRREHVNRILQAWKETA
jgi:hypothetical protein